MVPLTISKAFKLILFFPQMVCWNFSSRNLDFYKGFHLWTIDCVTVFQGLLCCGQEKLELVHEPLQGPHLEAKSGCQLSNAWVARFLSGPLVYDVVPQLPQKHFFPWMDVKFLSWGTSYATINVYITYVFYLNCQIYWYKIIHSIIVLFSQCLSDLRWCLLSLTFQSLCS